MGDVPTWSCLVSTFSRAALFDGGFYARMNKGRAHDRVAMWWDSDYVRDGPRHKGAGKGNRAGGCATMCSPF